MATLVYQAFSSSAMVSMGLYHLISTTKNHLKSHRDYFAKSYHPFSSTPSASSSFYEQLIGRNLQLYLKILCLFIEFFHQTLITSAPQRPHPVYRFTSLYSVVVLFLFLTLSIVLLLSEITSLIPFPPDLFFGVASGIFFLQYSVSYSSISHKISDLQAKYDFVSARISALSSILCLVLAYLPLIFVADVGLGASMLLHGLWTLQTVLSLYLDAYILEGCHNLLDVVSDIEGSTKCVLDESKLRAATILDLIFLIHVFFILLIVFFISVVVANVVGIRSRFGSYEVLANVVIPSTSTSVDANHIQQWC